jgi:hypothetical protein
MAQVPKDLTEIARQPQEPRGIAFSEPGDRRRIDRQDPREGGQYPLGALPIAAGGARQLVDQPHRRENSGVGITI